MHLTLPASTAVASDAPAPVQYGLADQVAPPPSDGQAAVDIDELTTRERDILVAIVRHCQATGGRAPGVRELCSAVGIRSTSVINYHLNKLRNYGLIRRRGTISRGIEVVGATWQPPTALAQLVAEGRASA